MSRGCYNCINTLKTFYSANKLIHALHIGLQLVLSAVLIPIYCQVTTTSSTVACILTPGTGRILGPKPMQHCQVTTNGDCTRSRVWRKAQCHTTQHYTTQYNTVIYSYTRSTAHSPYWQSQLCPPEYLALLSGQDPVRLMVASPTPCVE